MTGPAPVSGSTPRWPPGPVWGWTDVGIFFLLALPCLLAAALGGTALFQLFGVPVPLAARLMTIQFAGYGLWFAALWLLLRLRYDQPFWASMGWTAAWPGGAGVVLLGPVLAVSLALFGAAIKTPVADNPMLKLLEDRTALVIVGFFAVTLGPLAEELIFRGFLQPVAVRSLGAAAGVAVASAPFALLHGPQYGWSWRHILLLFVASAAFGVVRHRTGSTAAAAGMHAAYNLTFLAAYIIQKREILF
jgi:membrane protease YdiL (CAAX protease family)